MNEEEVLHRLEAAGGLYRDDHIVMTSGRHTDVYANFRPFFEEHRESELEAFCRALAERFRDQPEIEFVVGPKRGGAIIAERVSIILSSMLRTHIRPIVAFKREGEAEKDFTFYHDDQRYLERGRPGLFTDDVLATGSSLRPIQARINEAGSRLIAMGFMLNRSELNAADLNVPRLEALASIRSRSVTAEECAKHWLCQERKPINLKVGHGVAFLAKRSRSTI